jgi:hypothetical protein
MAGHHAGATSKRGHTARPNWLRAGANRVKQARGGGCLTSGQSSGSLGLASSEIDDRGGGRGSPVRSDGMGRARAGAGLREMGRGSERGHGRGSKRELGVVAENSSDVRDCTRWSTGGTGRAELIGEVKVA